MSSQLQKGIEKARTVLVGWTKMAEVVHSGFWGPINIMAQHGAYYLSCFIDT